MTYLALDVGTKRVGVAVGSTDIRLASPVGVFARGSLQADAARVEQWGARYDAEAIVVGLPNELDGTIGAQAQSVLDYVEQLREKISLPVKFFDERYSTATALARQREAGITDKRGRATIDAAAAAVILQDFLDANAPKD